jgi:hypothetical protein
MKRTMLGAVAGAGLVLAASLGWNWATQVSAQRPAPQPASSETSGWVVVPTTLGDKGQLITVIDPRQQAMAVYYLDFTSGKITLRSARTLRWDLQMTYLNNEPPLPQEIRGLLEQR